MQPKNGWPRALRKLPRWASKLKSHQSCRPGRHANEAPIEAAKYCMTTLNPDAQPTFPAPVHGQKSWVDKRNT
eukprot:1158702-Pelagomonas_calceolata.AAC.14